MFYIWRVYKKNTINTEPKKRDAFFSGFVSSFLQAFGMSVGVIRQAYLFSQGHNLQTVQATIAVVFLSGGIATIITRLFFEDGYWDEALSLLGLFPFMLLVVYLGKKVSYKIPHKIQEGIILYSLIATLILALPFLFK